jgi:hypothetical protein
MSEAIPIYRNRKLLVKIFAALVVLTLVVLGSLYLRFNPPEPPLPPAYRLTPIPIMPDSQSGRTKFGAMETGYLSCKESLSKDSCCRGQV